MSNTQASIDDIYDLVASLRQIGSDSKGETNTESDLVEHALIKLAVHFGLKHCSVFLLNKNRQLRCIVGTALGTGVVDKPGAIRTVNRYGRDEILYPSDEGIMGQIMVSGKPVFLNECEENAGFYLDFDDARSVSAGSLACLPIRSRNHVIGAINISHSEPDQFDKAWSSMCLLFTETLADLLTWHRKEAELRRKIKAQKESHSRALADANELRDKIQQLSIKDELTGLHNRRYFFEQGKMEMSRCCRHGTSLSLVMVDVDRLQHINDRCGQSTGDQVLKAIAGLLLGEARDGDIFVRFGGQEFLVLLPETDDMGAEQWAERIRTAITRIKVSCEKFESILTASFGISGLTAGSDTEDYSDLLDRVVAQTSDAMRQAKTAGRNTVVVYNHD